MKRITSLVLLIVFTIIPFVSVSAFEITCDEGIHEFEEFFNCHLTGANTNDTYDTLSGTITNNEYVNCLRYTDGVGLSNQNTTDNKVFSYIGKPTTSVVSTFRCQVIKKAEEDQRVQIFINDFKSHTNTQVGTANEEIVRSNYISIAKYVEKTTTASTKPRDTSNSNSRLKALADDNLNITFSGFITEYNAEVLYEVEKLNLKIYPFNSDASYRVVGNQVLNVGLNVIDVYVTSPDGASTTCYTLNVTRLEEGESIYYPESDSSLKNLTVTGYTIGFKPDVSEYKLHLDNQTSKVEVNAIPNVDKATVNISNTSNLSNGSVISITITSEDLTSETKYKIIITKDAPKKDYTSYIILGCLGVLGIIVIIIIIYTNKKNKKDPLLRIKNDKRKINKGKKANQNAIPEAESTINANAEGPQVNTNNNEPTAPNVIKADSVNVVTPMQMTEKIADPNLNKISTNTNSLDLSVSAKAMPQAISSPQVNQVPAGAVAANQNVYPQTAMPMGSSEQPIPQQSVYPTPQQSMQPQNIQTNMGVMQPQVIQSANAVPAPLMGEGGIPVPPNTVPSPPAPPQQNINNGSAIQSQNNNMIDLED
ncbi:MAG: cadherin-like beta sandwich domain-containing protein [Bacilli bacterium]|nr:cadherin-like beta sandwich domain-containing protein [Bacilli bacterium]